MIGVFDSGLGGLITLRSLIERLPDYDYIYFGDTTYLPYGDKPQQVIYRRTLKAVVFLFEKGCPLIILACHTASSQALRKIQKEYLPQNYPERRVLGVTIPVCETALEGLSYPNNLRIGILATRATCQSKSFEKELKKLNPRITVFCQPAPLLVPIIEEGRHDWRGLELCLEEYLKPLIEKKISLLILGCTHYPLIKQNIQKVLQQKIPMISANEILPPKLKDYLLRHPGIENQISKNRTRTYFLTAFSPHFGQVAERFFGRTIKPRLVDLG